MEALLKPAADQLLIIDYRRIENPGLSNVFECLDGFCLRCVDQPARRSLPQQA
jgi:hypothetical protein